MDMQGKGVRGSIFKVDLFPKTNFNEVSLVKLLKNHHLASKGFKKWNFDEDIISKSIEQSYKFDQDSVHLVDVDQKNMQKDANIPIIINNTKDYFAFDMHVVERQVLKNGKSYLRKDFYFNP